ncbi:MAG: hypothetical protein KKB70_07295 [Proteobacteria bacterium]|nr:hypothetical protein [Pseudomonadota bacterium]
MGSPAFNLKLPERFRPWHDAGLTHILRSFPEQKIHRPATPVEPQSPASKPAITWDPPWDLYWQKASKGAQVVLTYFELGADLAGRVDPNRSRLFKDIIGHLGWSGKGIVAFWPLAALHGDVLREQPEVFWQGIEQLGTTHVACFGKQSASLLSSELSPEVNFFVRGTVQVHVLPSPAELLTMLPHDRHLAVDRLAEIRLRLASS